MHHDSKCRLDYGKRLGSDDSAAVTYANSSPVCADPHQASTSSWLICISAIAARKPALRVAAVVNERCQRRCQVGCRRRAPRHRWKIKFP